MYEVLFILLLVVIVVFEFLFKRNITIKVEIPEIKIVSSDHVDYVPIEDIYDEKGDLLDKETKETIDDVLAKVNEIMYGEGIIERGDE